MLQANKSAIYAVIGSLFCIAFAQADGQLTVTEQLIRQEVLRLGGDWESSAKPKLVGFLGDKFESKHFEMLTHLPTVKWFAAHDCPIDSFALACISQIRQLERIDIVRCRLESECLSLLKSNRELKTIKFDSTTVSEKLIDELSQLTGLKNILFDDCDGLTEQLYSKLKTAIPEAEIDTIVSPKSEKK